MDMDMDMQTLLVLTASTQHDPNLAYMTQISSQPAMLSHAIAGVDALIDCGALTAGADNAKIAGELLVLMEGNGSMLSNAINP